MAEGQWGCNIPITIPTLQDSKKTVEGTAASVAAQLLYLWMLEGAGMNCTKIGLPGKLILS